MAKSRGLGQFSKSLLTGVKELDAELIRLKNRGTGLAKKGFSKCMTLLVKDMRRRAVKGQTGQLKKSIGKRFVKNRRSKEVTAKVGVNVAKKADDLKRAQAPHAHLVGLGTGPRTTRAGKSTGTMPKNPFVRESVLANIGQMQALLVKTIKAALAAYKAKRRSRGK